MNASSAIISGNLDRSMASAVRRKPTQAEQIASEILAEAFGTLRIRALKPAAIAELRAEVRRRLAFKWQQAA